MANIPQKVADRIAAGIKKFQPVLTAAKDHDANEADTVRIITDMLFEVFGYLCFDCTLHPAILHSSFCIFHSKK
jgi:hypothetical protein